MNEAPRRPVLLYVQHLLGVGHVKRAAAITRGLRELDIPVTVAFGGCLVPGVDFADATVVRLPAIQSADAEFSSLVNENREAVTEEMWNARETQLLEVYDRIQPKMILTEHFPFGRRKFRRELIPLFERAKAAGDVAIAGSIRDILIAPSDAAKTEKMIAMARKWFDAILVHSDPNVIKLEETFPAAVQIQDLLHYTGYIVDARQTTRKDTSDGQDEVLVSAGGGAVGSLLFQIAMEARRSGCLADKTWRFLTGGNLPQATIEELSRNLPQGVIVEPARPDFPELLKRSALSISQAGYNTVMDLLIAKCPAVIVPFATGGETEQTVRAEKLADAGILTHLPETELSPESLSNAAHHAISQRHDSNIPTGDLNGMANTAQLVARLLS